MACPGDKGKKKNVEHLTIFQLKTEIICVRSLSPSGPASSIVLAEHLGGADRGLAQAMWHQAGS